VKRVRNFCAGPFTPPVEVLVEVQDELLDFEVLFVQGGALLQFAMVPMNLLAAGSTAGYVRSGAWGRAAHADAERAASVYAAWDGTDAGFTRMPEPDEIKVEGGTRYVHLTSNETIEGIPLRTLPDVGVPLVVDISSDFLTRPLERDRVDLVYGGVQKNLGPAGLTGMAKRATRRSGLIYEVIDHSDGFYAGPAQRIARSRTNAVFRLASPELEGRFLARAREAGLINLEGHRSVGGIRASIYNAMPDEGVDELADFMREFARSAQ
jgi:phosphoserine aminotransferase